MIPLMAGSVLTLSAPPPWLLSRGGAPGALPKAASTYCRKAGQAPPGACQPPPQGGRPLGCLSSGTRKKQGGKNTSAPGRPPCSAPRHAAPARAAASPADAAAVGDRPCRARRRPAHGEPEGVAGGRAGGGPRRRAGQPPRPPRKRPGARGPAMGGAGGAAPPARPPPP